MKKTFLILLAIILFLLMFLLVWRRRAIKTGRWQKAGQETSTPAKTTPSATPGEEVSPEEAAVDKDLEELDKLMDDLDPQGDFQDIPDKDVGF